MLQQTFHIFDRFWDKVQVDPINKCWNWMSYRDKDGYGVFGFDNKNIRAHRFAYELHKGRIPEGLVIDHLCKNTSCVNPSHLEAIKHRENLRRSDNYIGVNMRKTHCPKGHEYTPENTNMTPKGSRDCKACDRIRYPLKPKSTHCKRGHPFSEDNTYIDPRGNRNCKKCKLDRQNISRRNLRASLDIDKNPQNLKTL